MDAYTAGKLLAILFFALTVFPLYALIKNVFSTKTAVIACMLFVLCSRIMRYAGDGLLSTGKIFFLVSLAWVLYEIAVRPRWYKPLLLGGIAAGLSLIRAEGI
ncbi:MAG: glycosyltransferase family 39 protein, partial [Lentisphaeria bacterium]